jgi:hypothetical protein
MDLSVVAPLLEQLRPPPEVNGAMNMHPGTFFNFAAVKRTRLASAGGGGVSIVQ